MMKHRLPTTETFIFDETSEQTARAISDALAYLQHEADAVGMRDVSKLIKQALAKAGQYRSTH